MTITEREGGALVILEMSTVQIQMKIEILYVRNLLPCPH